MRSDVTGAREEKVTVPMISPAEKFNAFTNNRFVKRQENVAFGARQNLVLSPTRSAFFLFVHLLNRSVMSTPWIFWFTLIVTLIQIGTIVVLPFHTYHWAQTPSMSKANYVICCICSYCPPDASRNVCFILFGVYSVLIVSHFVLFCAIIHLLKKKKDAMLLIKIFFFASYLFLPFMRSSFCVIVARAWAEFTRNTGFDTFFLSLVATIVLVILFFMVGVCQFMMGSSPSPNMANPLAIWAPCVWRAVVFEVYVCLTCVLLEITKNLRGTPFIVILCVVEACCVFPQAVYQTVRQYFVWNSAYEYIGAISWGMLMMSIVHITVYFKPGVFVMWSVLLMALVCLVVAFLVMKIQVEIRKWLLFKRLAQCGTPTVAIPDPEEQQDTDDANEPLLHSSTFDALKLKTVGQALFAVRNACITNHTSFGDTTLLQYCVAKFPKGLFYFLHMAFLVPNQTSYLQQLMDELLEAHKPSLLEGAVLFQIITSLQESSNDVPQALVRELGKQKLQAMKCHQLLSRFWTACYKGDLTQMSRNAFTLNRHVTEVNDNWRMLVQRYPLSTPVLKDYVQYLTTTGAQHALAEAIVANRPCVGDMTTSTTCEQDLNVPLLHQAVEEAVDRRPIRSTRKFKYSALAAVTCALIFFAVAVAAGLYFMDMFDIYNKYSYESSYFAALLTQGPCMYDDIRYSDSNSLTPNREKMYVLGAQVENALNALFEAMPDSILDNGAAKNSQLFLEADEYRVTKGKDLVGLLRFCSYFTFSLAYVDSDDGMVDMDIKNIPSAVDVIFTAAKDSVKEMDHEVTVLAKYTPIFYAAVWLCLFVIVVPLFWTSYRSLKAEMTYLFSLYLTIPRSLVSRFMDGPSKVDKKVSMFTATTDQPLGKGEDESQSHANVADSFKLMVSDSSTHISVLPRVFVIKSFLVSCFLVVAIAILATVASYELTHFTGNMLLSYHTERLISERTVLCSLIMHGLTSLGADLSPDLLDLAIQNVSRIHTAIIFKDPAYSVSPGAVDSKELSSLHSNEVCSDKGNLSCRSLSSLFEYFTNQATNITTLLRSGTKLDPKNDNFKELRRIFNDDLFLRLLATQKAVDKYSRDSITRFRNILLIIILVGIIGFLIVFAIFVIPIIRGLENAIQSVKLPLKHISPMEIPDLPKILSYLQGECDWGMNTYNEHTENKTGNCILSAMSLPFAVFESDLSLLFANGSFYSLLGTSKEAAVGLAFADIFGAVIPFKSSESHPFNTLVNHISQLQQGTASSNVAEIKTELEVPRQPLCPVMIRVVGLANNEKKDKETGSDYVHAFRANSFVVFMNNLSYRRDMEQKIRYEADVSQRLITSAIPRDLYEVLRNGDEVEAKKYDNVPMLLFHLIINSHDDISDDDHMIACGSFMRTSVDINRNFTSVCRLVNEPPLWIYISGYGEKQGDIDYSTAELAHFALSVIEAFKASSSSKFSLGAILHTGDLTILPVKLELPIVEAIGRGFMLLRQLQRAVKGNKLLATQETKSLLQDQKGFTIAKFGDTNTVDGRSRTLFQVQRVMDNDDFGV